MKTKQRRKSRKTTTKIDRKAVTYKVDKEVAEQFSKLVKGQKGVKAVSLIENFMRTYIENNQAEVSK